MPYFRRFFEVEPPGTEANAVHPGRSPSPKVATSDIVPSGRRRRVRGGWCSVSSGCPRMSRSIRPARLQDSMLSETAGTKHVVTLLQLRRWLERATAISSVHARNTGRNNYSGRNRDFRRTRLKAAGSPFKSLAGDAPPCDSAAKQTRERCRLNTLRPHQRRSAQPLADRGFTALRSTFPRHRGADLVPERRRECGARRR